MEMKGVSRRGRGVSRARGVSREDELRWSSREDRCRLLSMVCVLSLCPVVRGCICVWVALFLLDGGCDVRPKGDLAPGR